MTLDQTAVPSAGGFAEALDPKWQPQRSPEKLPWRPSIGAWQESGLTRFRVWAPQHSEVSVVFEDDVLPSFRLTKADDGTFSGAFEKVAPGTLYRYQVDGEGPYPDPASRFQPRGVHGPSQVVSSEFAWSDQGWRGVPNEELVVYELHLGAFTKEGTFAAAADRLPYLKALGVTAVELMPIADFPGTRNWGYDGVALFAPSRAYGTPDDLRRYVDRAHALGLAVFLDVVYNHFGPSGNYTAAYSKEYLSSSAENPWGACVNLDGPGSSMVRELFIENALYWIHEFHLDGLRLDATHALIDRSPKHFVAELVQRVKGSITGREIQIIAEDHRNMAKMVLPASEGGWDLDGVWADDFHHQVRRCVAGDNQGYYQDYSGSAPDIAATINQGWFFTGQRSLYLNEDRGTDPAGVEARRFVICLQNHDQVGNRARGERLHHQIDAATYRAACMLLLCAPRTPLLFMGQEWAASTPFLYFTDHEQELGRLITEGRRKEFGHFSEFFDPELRETIPDPQAESTYAASKLRWEEVEREPHAAILRLNQALLALRKKEKALRPLPSSSFHARALDEATILLRCESSNRLLYVAARFQGKGTVPLPADHVYQVLLSTEDAEFTSDPARPKLRSSGDKTMLCFFRPSAIVLLAE